MATTDKDLLELAAKAAGLKPFCFIEEVTDHDSPHWGGPAMQVSHSAFTWNPLTDDGDALRLAVNWGALDIALAVGELVLAEGMPSPTSEDEKMAFVRRAIVCDVVRRAATTTQASEKP